MPGDPRAQATHSRAKTLLLDTARHDDPLIPVTKSDAYEELRDLADESMTLIKAARRDNPARTLTVTGDAKELRLLEACMAQYRAWCTGHGQSAGSTGMLAVGLAAGVALS